ncbi:hypothetical protein N9934_03900 [Desulfosarcina sp.]|nr:hypothetical protein [Desulfosarcina sp.]
MEEKKTRIAISSDLQELLNDYIENQKAKGVKGVTKIKVMEELCTAGLAYQKQSELNGVQENTPAGVRQPIYPFSAEYIPETKSELKAMQEALYEKEQRLIEKERFLLEKELMLDKKQHASKSNSNNAQKDISREMEAFNDKMKLRDKLDNLKDGNEEIKKDIRSMNRELLRLLREIKRNTESDMFYDKVLPVLTAAGVGANAFKNFNLDDTIKNLTGNLSKANKGKQGNIPKQGDANTKKKEG